MRDPRKNIPEDKYCVHIYGEEKPDRVGEQCRAIRQEGSKFCYFHQPDQEKVMKQLAEAREARGKPPNEKHGFYTKGKKECNTCSLGEGCEFFEPNKKVCDFQVKPDIDLSSLASIQGYAEKIVASEWVTFQKLDQVVNTFDTDSAELIDLKRRYAKTMLSILKDFASVKDTYEKRKDVSGWESILSGKKT